MSTVVIFDLDGTLIHIPIDYDSLFSELKRILNTDQVRPMLRTISKLEGNNREEVFRAWDKAEWAALPETITNEVRMAVYNEHCDKLKALVTMQGKAFVNEWLRNCDLAFDTIVTREDSLNRVEQLKIAAKRLGSRFEDVLFIGDKEYDLTAAKQVGCLFQRMET